MLEQLKRYRLKIWIPDKMAPAKDLTKDGKELTESVGSKSETLAGKGGKALTELGNWDGYLFVRLNVA